MEEFIENHFISRLLSGCLSAGKNVDLHRDLSVFGAKPPM